MKVKNCQPLIDKLCLGTAQFGLDYGIANNSGKVKKRDAFRILEYAHHRGIRMLDTAPFYGGSEKTIGEFMSGGSRRFDIVSKRRFGRDSTPLVEGYFNNTLENLGQKKIYGCLVHGFEDISAHKKKLRGELESIKKDGFAEKIGVSLYKTKELEYIFENGIPIDIIQLPYNVFDRRFERYFKRLKDRKVEIHARSVFLQGLFFLDKRRIGRYFKNAKKALEGLGDISRKNSIPVNSLCISFAMLNPLVDKVIIGVDSLRQLKENIRSLGDAGRVKKIYKELSSLEFHDETVILPTNWRKR